MHCYPLNWIKMPSPFFFSFTKMQTTHLTPPLFKCSIYSLLSTSVLQPTCRAQKVCELLDIISQVLQIVETLILHAGLGQLDNLKHKKDKAIHFWLCKFPSNFILLITLIHTTTHRWFSPRMFTHVPLFSWGPFCCYDRGETLLVELCLWTEAGNDRPPSGRACQNQACRVSGPLGKELQWQPQCPGAKEKNYKVKQLHGDVLHACHVVNQREVPLLLCVAAKGNRHTSLSNDSTWVTQMCTFKKS